MSYTPTTWVDGVTLVNAENLNKLEQGVANADKRAMAAVKTVNGIGPDENGNVVVEGGGGGNVDLTGYATEEWVREGYQPKGEYLTAHQDISGKLDASALPTAINTALAQAKASGEFNGEPGKDYTLTDSDKQEIAELAAPLVDVPQGGGGAALETLIDKTLTEDVVSINYDFGKAYKYLELYIYTPKAASNTTNNNVILLYPNGIGGYQFNVGSLSIYGAFMYNITIKCFDEGLTYLGAADNTCHAGCKKDTLFANGIQTATLIPKTSGETETIPVGTHIIIRGREEL